jgi:glycosyltransferase involved in cell wall biosynthesis
MKIAIITFRFAAPGGVETNVLEVGRRLRARGDRVEVFASELYDEGRWQRRTEFPAEVDGIPVHWFPVRARLLPGITMPLLLGLMDALAECAPDVIHAHSHRYGHVLEAAAVARRRRIPLVVSTHYHPADRRESALKRGALRVQDVLFGVSAYRIARDLVVETEHEAALVREFAPADRIRVVPPGIDLAEWSDPARDRVPDGAVPAEYLLFAGRIAPNKGLPFLLDALAALPPDRRSPLVLMGPDWGERSSLEARARRLGIERDLVFLGHVGDTATYRGIVRGARALVLPSEYEAFGLVLLEAMAASTPIVATAVGGVPEALDGGRAGRLVPYGDVPALAASLASVDRREPATAALVRAGSEWVRRFDWSVATDRLRAIYGGAGRTDGARDSRSSSRPTRSSS